ncbi:MAG: Rid family detoxifying hydrolase [Candidatus Subteraquimicrobiales bacterium]|nr:Rid family detoxifying hydrolase [Candidatus Subteraquimicrobiales bacterium]
MKVAIITEDAPFPVGPYSQAVKANGFIFVSGQIPIDAQTDELVNGDIEKQTRLVLQNIKSILEAGDSSLAKVVKLTVFLKNIGDLPRVNKVFEECFLGEFPARESVEVSQLPKEAKIEISAIAIINS